MASIQDKVDSSNSTLRRKLFDNNIKVLGNEILAVRLTVEENQYGDEGIEILREDKITIIVTFPEDKLMTETFEDEETGNSQTNFMLYDVIPIEVYSKFEDKLNGKDLLIFKYTNENQETGKVILKVTRIVSNFNKSIVWKQYLCAMYHNDPFTELGQIIDRYLQED